MHCLQKNLREEQLQTARALRSTEPKEVILGVCVGSTTARFKGLGQVEGGGCESTALRFLRGSSQAEALVQSWAKGQATVLSTADPCAAETTRVCFTG